MYNKIVNPITGRKVNIYGSLGRTIIKNYLLFYQQGGDDGDEKDEILDNAKVYAPDKYFEGLNAKETQKRLERIEEGAKSDHKDQNAYRPFETDFRNGERIKTKQSRYTKQWKKYFPDANSLEEKAELTGVPLEIVQKVFDKGMAAWRTGHRPGANAHQWGYARVHSFLVKGKAYYTADRSLAIRANKESEKARDWFEWVDGLCDGDSYENNKKWCKRACEKIDCKN